MKRDTLWEAAEMEAGAIWEDVEGFWCGSVRVGAFIKSQLDTEKLADEPTRQGSILPLPPHLPRYTLGILTKGFSKVKVRNQDFSPKILLSRYNK